MGLGAVGRSATCSRLQGFHEQASKAHLAGENKDNLTTGVLNDGRLRRPRQGGPSCRDPPLLSPFTVVAYRPAGANPISSKLRTSNPYIVSLSLTAPLLEAGLTAGPTTRRAILHLRFLRSSAEAAERLPRWRLRHGRQGLAVAASQRRRGCQGRHRPNAGTTVSLASLCPASTWA